MKMQRQSTWPKCATTVASSTNKLGLLGALFVLTAVVACVLNLDRIVIREIHLFARVGIPIAILAGVIGTVQDRRALSSAASAVFWVGIVFLFLVIVGTIAPRDWVFDPRNTPQPNLTFLALRCLFLISVATLLAVLFRSLKNTKYTAALGANDGRE
jgi:phosphoglycerol transferase MdoB-like AlkP superfamily enzyme